MKKMRVLVIGVLLIAVSGLMAAQGPLTSGNAVLVLDLGGNIPETVPWNPFLALFTEPPATVMDKLTTLRLAAKDPRIKGVVVRITETGGSFGKAQEFRAALADFRKTTNKPIYAYLELEGGGNLEYYLASACAKVYLSPGSMLNLTGLSVFRFYLGGVWDKIYVDMQVDQIKEYKSFADMIGRRDMSAAEKEVQDSILDSLYAQFTGDIAKSRGVSPDQVKSWIDAAWLVPEKYVAAGAVDGEKYQDEVEAMIGGAQTTEVKERDFLRIMAPGKKLAGPQVAVFYAVGNIVAGEPGGLLGPGNVVASDPVVKALQKLLQDDAIKAVILRIDSGGGSALASDLIWRATQQVRAKKPIVVSMSDVAASGGYFIACGGNKIVAQPGTITGSIGILSAYPTFGRLFQKFGIGTATMGRGQFSTMGAPDRKLTEAEFQKMHEGIAALYDLFLDRVSQGRGLTKEKVNAIGRGRVWTGEQARERGLVDRLGGFPEAVDEVKKLLHLSPGQEVVLVYKREPVSLWKLLTGRAEESVQESLFSAEELELIHALRFQGLYRPGQPLAILPGPMRIE